MPKPDCLTPARLAEINTYSMREALQAVAFSTAWSADFCSRLYAAQLRSDLDTFLSKVVEEHDPNTNYGAW